MKKAIAMILSLTLLLTACSALASGLLLPEIGLGADAFNYQEGNFESVSNDGSVAMKMYVYNTWTPVEGDLTHAGEAVTAMWTRGEDTAFQTLMCQFYAADAFAGIGTLDDMLAYQLSVGYEGALVSVNGVTAILSYAPDMTVMGLTAKLDNGWLSIMIQNISGEAAQTEAMNMLSSLVAD